MDCCRRSSSFDSCCLSPYSRTPVPPDAYFARRVTSSSDVQKTLLQPCQRSLLQPTSRGVRCFSHVPGALEPKRLHENNELKCLIGRARTTSNTTDQTEYIWFKDLHMCSMLSLNALGHACLVANIVCHIDRTYLFQNVPINVLIYKRMTINTRAVSVPSSMWWSYRFDSWCVRINMSRHVIIWIGFTMGGSEPQVQLDLLNCYIALRFV